MFHTESRMTENVLSVSGFEPYAIFPLVSEGLIKTAIGLKWPNGYVIKKGYFQDTVNNCTYKLIAKHHYRYRGIVSLSLPADELNASLARIFTQHPNKLFYKRGAYFVPAMPGDDQAQYDFYYLDFHMLSYGKPSRYYVVVEQGLTIKKGDIGDLFAIAGTYKPKHSVIGPMAFSPRRQTSPVLIKTARSSSSNPDQRFFTMFQNEVNGMRACGDVKVKHALLFSKEFGGKEYKTASQNPDDYKNNSFHGLESVIVMPFIVGYTLEELYEIRTPAANARYHQERLDLMELEERDQARIINPDAYKSEFDADEILRVKISVRDFLRSEEGRLLVARQCIQRLRDLHAKGIIHGDIKDANIMVEVNLKTKSVMVRFIDFGFSRSLFDEATAQPFEDRIAGTIQNLAPEILACLSTAKIAPFNEITDEYALATVLLEVFGCALISNFSGKKADYIKMRCEQERIQHQLFYKLNYQPTTKEKITAIFDEWVLRDPNRRLRLTSIQERFNQVTEEHYALKFPDQAVMISANHQMALAGLPSRSLIDNAGSNIQFALALCEALKACLKELNDQPAAISLFAHTVNVEAFMRLQTIAAMLEVIDRYYAEYVAAYELCQQNIKDLRALEPIFDKEPAAKREELHVYLEHASVFMQTREEQRCCLDELAVEAEHMRRASKKFTSTLEGYLRPKQ